jgi:nucleoside 2-deoxyribosyltransferase
MKEIKVPNRIEKRGLAVFLAGSIEMGKAVNWRTEIVNSFKENNITFLNPRRDDWDSSWKQSIENDKFREQVEWELEAMEQADVILMYFDKDTKSPITLLELGLFAHSKKLVVCCPDGFWRKGNVDIVCARYHIMQEKNLNDLKTSISLHYV